jgi:hypothetical protein
MTDELKNKTEFLVIKLYNTKWKLFYCQIKGAVKAQAFSTKSTAKRAKSTKVVLLFCSGQEKPGS